MVSCHFTAPGAVIAALPATLGFVPVTSLVLVGFRADRIVVAMRADLHADLRGDIGQVAKAAARSGIDAATAVVIDNDGALCPMCLGEHRQLCEALDRALAEESIDLRGAHIVDVVAAGGRWKCLQDCGAAGDVPDPDSSPAAVAAVLSGRRLYARREDLELVVAISDEARTAALAEVIAGCENGVPAESAVGAARAAAALLAANGDLADLRIAGLVLCMGQPAARRALYALAVAPDAGALEALWAFLVRTTPMPWRVEVLVIQAMFAYVRGDGPLAAVALEAVLAADPVHGVGGKLCSALRTGVPPRVIPDLAANASEGA